MLHKDIIYYCTISTRCSVTCQKQKKMPALKIRHKSKQNLLAFLETKNSKFLNTRSKWYSIQERGNKGEVKEKKWVEGKQCVRNAGAGSKASTIGHMIRM